MSEDQKKREPRVLKTIVVASDAGTPSPDQQDRDRRAIEADCREWERRFERILRLEIMMFDTDDRSGMDMMQAADGQCRKYDSIMQKKSERGQLVKAEMAEIERAGKHQLEFNEIRWMQLDEQLQLLRQSYLKFSVAFRVALRVRAAIHSYTGSTWGEYRSAADFKAQRANSNKQKMAVVDASLALGLNPIQYAAWKEWRLHYEASVDGVDAEPNIAGPDFHETEALRDHQHKQQLREKDADANYTRRKPRVVPKKDVSFEPSGERGSRHQALEEAAKKAKKSG